MVIKEGRLGQNSLDTWIRLEDGTISGKVTLNSTYGKDKYVAVGKMKSYATSGVKYRSGEASVKILSGAPNGTVGTMGTMVSKKERTIKTPRPLFA